MRRRRNGGRKRIVATNKQDARGVALDWRKRLQIDTEYHPDIELILRRPRTAFPNIKVRTFSASAYRKQRVRGWANTKTRTINISDSVEIGLKYGDPKSRWDAVHEVAHIALSHAGNNLLMGKPYPIEDRGFEKQVDEFIFEFLAPLHLAVSLNSVDEYERRFGIPRDKAIIRKHQVDELRRRALIPTRSESQHRTSVINRQSALTKCQDPRAQKHSPSIVPEQIGLPFPQLPEQSRPLHPTQLAIRAHTNAGTNVQALVKSEPISPSSFDGSSSLDPTSEDRELVRILLRDANRKITRYRKSIKAIVGFATMLIGSLPLLTETVDGNVKIGALAISGLIGATLSFLQILDRPIGLEGQLKKLAWTVLKNLADRRGVTLKLGKFNICYEQNRFVIQD